MADLKVWNQDFEKAEYMQPGFYSLQASNADQLNWEILNIWPLVYVFT